MKIVGVLVILIVVCFGYTQAPDTLWTKTYGGPEDDWASVVRQTSDGGYIIVGTTHSFGMGSPSSIWLIKTDANGNTLWTATYGNTNMLMVGGNDVQQTSDGGYIIAGGCWTLTLNGWLIKTDSTGSVLWSVLGGENFASVIQTPDGGYIAAGNVGNPRFCNAYLSKKDSLGAAQWDRIYEHASRYSGANSVVRTTDGGYVAAGADSSRFYYFKTDSLGYTLWFNVFNTGFAHSIKQEPDGGFAIAGETSGGGFGGTDICLVKCDSAGNSYGMWPYGGPSDDMAYSLEICADSTYIVAGYTESFGAGNSDVYLLRIDVDGAMLWANTYGGAANDGANSVQRTTDGGYIIAGYTESFGAGGRDVYLIKTEPDVGIEENDPSIVANKDITATILRGQLRLPEGKKCKVFDITGRIVEPNSMTRGIYFIEVDGVVTQKVVKVR